MLEPGTSEAAFVVRHLRIAYDAEARRLAALEEGSDERAELANDLMRLETIIAKYSARPRLVR